MARGTPAKGAERVRAASVEKAPNPSVPPLHRGESLVPSAPAHGVPAGPDPRSAAPSGLFRRAALALACAIVPTCTTTTTVGPASAPSAVLTPLPAVKGWAVVERGAAVGSVISYRSTDESQRILYAVRNEWFQDMGTVDAMGRAWRRVPHGEDEWLGTGTVLDGARRILGLEDDVRLEQRPLDALRTAPAAQRERDDG